MMRRIAIEVLCLLLTGLFTYASIVKLIDYDVFKMQIGQSPLLTSFAGLIAVIIPSFELITAGILMVPCLRLVGLYASFGLMVMFTAYIVAILGFSERIPCSCGGILEMLGWTEHLILNIFLTVAAFYGVLYYSCDPADGILDPVPER